MSRDVSLLAIWIKNIFSKKFFSIKANKAFLFFQQAKVAGFLRNLRQTKNPPFTSGFLYNCLFLNKVLIGLTHECYLFGK